MIKNLLPLGITSILLTASCVHATIQTYQFTPKLNFNTSTDEGTGTIGTGYSSDQTAFVANCINSGPVKYEGGSKSIVNLSDQISFSELEKSLSIKVSGHGSIDIFSGSSSSSFYYRSKDDDYSRSFLYKESIKYPTATYTLPANVTKANDSLNNLGQIYQSSPSLFRQFCGDRFVYQVTPGANLFVTVKIYFKTHTEKMEYDQEGSASVAFGGLSASMQAIINKLNLKGSISIYAYQMGGDPSQLGSIVGAPPNSTTAPVVECSFTNLQACQSVLNKILQYSAGSFANQVKMKDGKLPQNATMIDYTLKPYGYAGVIVQSDNTVTPEIQKARNTLTDEYLLSKKQLNHVDNLIQLTSGDSALAKYLMDLRSKLAKNSSILQDAGVQCFTDASQCISVKSSAEASLIDVSQQIAPFKNNWSYKQDPWGWEQTDVEQISDHDLFIAPNAHIPAYHLKITSETPQKITAQSIWSSNGNGCRFTGTGDIIDNKNVAYSGQYTCTTGGYSTFVLTKSQVD